VAKDLAGTVQVSCGLLQVVSREDRHLIKKLLCKPDNYQHHAIFKEKKFKYVF
jgi:hypothetical protein